MTRLAIAAAIAAGCWDAAAMEAFLSDTPMTWLRDSRKED